MVLADKQAKQVQWTNVYLDALVPFVFSNSLHGNMVSAMFV